jgi:hypothetical protein
VSARHLLTAPSGAVVWALLLSIGCSEPPKAPRAEAPEPPPVTVPRDRPKPVEGQLAVDLHVDATDPRSRTFEVTQTWHGANSPLRFKAHGDDAYGIERVRLRVDGEPRPFRREGRTFTPQPPIDGVATLTYVVRPGGNGPLGHQGFLDEEFGVFDGRAFLLPISRQPVGQARVSFTLPDGWVAAHPLLPADTEGWWRWPSLDPIELGERLRTDCFGIGPFDLREAEVAGQPVRSYVHPELKPGFTSYLHDSTLELASWLHGSVGYAPTHPRAFVRTPGRGGRVFGGISPGGTCFEGRAADKRIRNAQLLARRMAEPLTSGPGSLRPATSHDRWFIASLRHYLDLVATEATGALEPGLLGPDLWLKHQEETANRPRWATTPLAHELRVDSPTSEYLRSVRGPLALHALAALVRQRTDTTLEAFVAHLVDRGDPVAVQADLEAFTGASFDDVFAAWVDGELPMVPQVPGLITPWARDRAARPMVARTAGYPVPVDYIAHRARSGDHDRYRTLFAELGEEGPTRDALAAGGVRLVQGEVLDHLGGIDPRTRTDLVRAEAQWPEGPGAVAGSLRWLDHPAAADLQALLEAERAYEDQLRTSGVERIAVRPGPKDGADQRDEVLVVSPEEHFTIFVRYHAPPPSLAVEVWRDGERHFGLPVLMEPGWSRNRIEVGVADRPATPGVFEVRVVAPDGTVWARRSFWQHPLP